MCPLFELDKRHGPCRWEDIVIQDIVIHSYNIIIDSGRKEGGRIKSSNIPFTSQVVVLPNLYGIL